MSDSALEAPQRPPLPAGEHPDGPEPQRRPAGAAPRGHAWWWIAGGVILLAGFSLALLRWAKTSPGYDPYGWLVWGHQTLHLNLNLGGAPSWKPLPFLFAVPFALFGHFALWMWATLEVTAALAGAFFAGRITYKLVSADDSPRWAALVGAAFAGCAVLGIQQYMHYVLSSQSDPLIVTLVLAAVDFHLEGWRRWAFAMLVLASLGRPEAWPFCFLYGVLLWRTLPKSRWMVVGGLVVIPLVWFGVPVLSGQSPLVAGQLAERSPRELHQNKIIGELDRFVDLEYFPVWLLALAAVAIAFIRRNRTVLVLAAASAAWVIIEVAFVLHGWPGVPRYVMEPAGVAFALAGVGVGWLLADARKIAAWLPRWAGIPVVAVLVAALVPGALSRARTEHADIHHERLRTHEIALLNTTIQKLGGYKHVVACGEPVTNVGYASILAYFTKLNVGVVGYLPHRELSKGYPIVVFTSLPNGWGVTPYHQHPGQQASCAGLRATYTDTHGQTDPVLVHQ